MAEKSTRGLFSRPVVIAFCAPLAAAFIMWVIDRAFPRLNLLGEVAKGFIWIHGVKIPGSVVLVLTIAAAVIIFRLSRRRQYVVDTGNQRTEEVKPEAPTPTEEQFLVLVALAGGKDSWTDDPLYRLYTERFPNNGRLHFNLLIDEMERSKLINVTHNYSGETYYTIMPKGRDIVRDIVKNMKASEAQDAATEPNPSPKK